MDAISYSYADKAQKRIKKFIENPDSTSGVVTVPTTIAAGETITIPAGRMAVLPDLQIDGDLVVDGEVFIPSGATFGGVVEKVASIDNAIVRFDGTSGAVQNSGVTIDDNNNVVIPGSSSGTNGGAFVLVKNGATSNIGIGNYSALNGGAYDATSTIWCNGGLNITDNTTSRIKIDSAGNVGIGVTPAAWTSTDKALQIGSTTAIFNYTNNTYNRNNAYRDNSGVNRYLTNGYATSFDSVINGSYIWSIAPVGTAGNAITWTTAMILDTSGSLTVGGNSTMSVINAKYDASNYIYTQARNTADTTEVFISLIGGVKRSAILANGTFQSATNVYGSTSDIKLKENVVDTTPKLDKLMQVQVRNFNYIGQEDKQIGVIAQEIEQIFPSVVFETKDTKQVEVTKQRVIPAVEEVKDEEGNVITEAKTESIEEYTEIETQETGEVTKNVKYSIIYMMMLKGMQEQQEIINDLKSRIEILEGAK